MPRKNEARDQILKMLQSDRNLTLEHLREHGKTDAIKAEAGRMIDGRVTSTQPGGSTAAPPISVQVD